MKKLMTVATVAVMAMAFSVAVSAQRSAPPGASGGSKPPAGSRPGGSGPSAGSDT